jgi:hypothetical protein
MMANYGNYELTRIALIEQTSSFSSGCGDKIVTKLIFLRTICMRIGILRVTTDMLVDAKWYLGTTESGDTMTI